MGKAFTVAMGLNYGEDNKRAEIGELVNDLPEDDIVELLALGAIVPVEPAKRKGTGKK